MAMAVRFAVLGIAVLVAAGCGSDKRSVPADAAAVVGDRTVSKEALSHALAHASCGYGPSCPTRREVLDVLVDQAEFEQKAVEMGIAPSDDDVGRHLERLIQQYFRGSESAYRRQLRQQGLSEWQVEADLRAQLVRERVFAAVTRAVLVREADIKARYERDKSQYVRPPRRLARQIVVGDKAKADRLYAKLRAGASFARLARRYSHDTKTSVRGGRFLHRRGDRASAGFDRMVFSLEVGEIGRPFGIVDAWYIVQALGPTEGPKWIPLKRARPWIRENLLQERRQTAFASWRARVEREFADRTWYQPGFTQD